MPLDTTAKRASAPSSHSLFEERIRAYSAHAIERFKSITRTFSLFHVLFFALGVAEIFCFLLFFSFFTKSAMLAFFLAGLFFTGFSYFVLLFYFQAKKPEQLAIVRTEFVEACRTRIPSMRDESESHLIMAEALKHLSTSLQGQEYNFYPFFKTSPTLSLLLKKFSLWTHWRDLHEMREQLLLLAIQEHIEVVKLKPTDLEVHAALGAKYIALSKLYMDPRKKIEEEEVLWTPPAYASKEMQDKFNTFSSLAIEEFKIIESYAPQDPWVHAQLASLYHDLKMHEKEIQEYELLHHIAPQDKEVLFRLGVLYFQQGYNAKGLKVYEQLKKTHEGKAEQLISHYGYALSF